MFAADAANCVEMCAGTDSSPDCGSIRRPGRRESIPDSIERKHANGRKQHWAGRGGHGQHHTAESGTDLRWHYLVRGQEDSDILAHAVVFSDGVQTGAVVSATCLVIDRGTILWIKELASLRTGIPQDNMIYRCHPLTRGAGRFAYFRAGDQPDPFYADFMVTRIVEAIEKAHSRRCGRPDRAR